MAYIDKEIKTVMTDITENKLYLPAIQRKLVWDYEQIERLFDSLMRGYPIGTFLFWKLDGVPLEKYTFYDFVREYTEGTTRNIPAASPDDRTGIMGVLDGQQRLNSMYIALKGTYAYKKRHARRSDPNAFPRRTLCLNPLFSPAKKDEEEGENGVEYQFKFLTDEEMQQIDKSHAWFPIKDVLLWKDISDINEKIEKRINSSTTLKELLENNEKKKQVVDNLFLLWQRLVFDKPISYFEVKEQELDKIVDIFIRVNSGGTHLSKTDLLFSTIVAQWENGRDEIESLLDEINGLGDGFCFSKDFLMRACLVLTDSPILFKVRTFKKENVKRIKKNWGEISSAIRNSVNFISEFGFGGDTLTSQMAILPVSYFFIKNGNNYRISEESKSRMRTYLIKSLLKQIFGGQSDQTLTKIRDAIKENSKQDFPLSSIKKLKFSGNKTFRFEEEDIEELLEAKKGAYTFMVLSRLYPNLRYGQVKFHQDHLHPAALFTSAKLRKIGIPEEKIKDWQDKKDTLPNLQLLEGVENKSKNKTPLRNWVDGKVLNKEKYLKENYIPKDVSLELTDFDVFYSKRKKLLKQEIKGLLV